MQIIPSFPKKEVHPKENSVSIHSAPSRKKEMKLNNPQNIPQASSLKQRVISVAAFSQTTKVDTKKKNNGKHKMASYIWCGVILVPGSGGLVSR